MSDLRLSAHEVEDLLAGRQPDGRADLAPLAEVAAVLHASREVEPPPPMSDDLLAEIERGGHSSEPAAGPRHARRHRPRHLASVPTGRRLAATPLRRPVVSLGAAAALLIGLVVVTSVIRPGGVDSVSDVGSAIGLDVFRGDSAAPETPSTTTSTTTTTLPPTTAAPPQPTTTVAPAPSGAPPPGEAVPGAGQDPSWWFSPEAWELFQRYWDDGDGRDWGDGRDGGSGPAGGDRQRDGRDGSGEFRTGDGSHNGDGGGSSTSSTSTDTSTSTSGASSSPDTRPPDGSAP